jgi:hypothetical protein
MTNLWPLGSNTLRASRGFTEKNGHYVPFRFFLFSMFFFIHSLVCLSPL